MRALPRSLAAGVLLASLAAGTSAHATPEADLATAENSYAALEYASALSSAEAVLAQSHLSHDVLTRATRVSALSHAALGHTDQAKQQFIVMLEYDPDFKVDAKLGPRFSEPFSEARGYWQAQGRKGGMDVQVVTTYGQPGDLRIAARDPLGIVKHIDAGYRWAPKRDYTNAEVEPNGKSIEVTANPEGSTRLEYWVRAIDAKGNAVFESGTPDAPQINVVPEPDRSGAIAKEKKKSFFTNPVVLVVGGVIIAGAAVGMYFAFRPTHYHTPSVARGVLGASCGGTRCD